jgi:hypothetical protein
MDLLRRLLRYGFDVGEKFLALAFPASWNPLLNLGALGFYWIVTASGIYIYIFFDTGVSQAFASVEYMTNDQWYAAGLMRSLHRYASDGLVAVMLLHILREFALDHYRGVRWFSWATGLPVLVLVYVAGISGYWLVWDKLAQYVAIVSTEWLDHLPFFGQPRGSADCAGGSVAAPAAHRQTAYQPADRSGSWNGAVLAGALRRGAGDQSGCGKPRGGSRPHRPRLVLSRSLSAAGKTAGRQASILPIATAATVA